MEPDTNIPERKQYSFQRSQLLRFLRFFITCFMALHSLYSVTLFAQNHEREQEELEREIERVMELQEDDENGEDLQTLMEEMEWLHEQLIDINRATFDELVRVPGLTNRLVHNIIRYRDENGHFHSVDEMLHVPGIGPVTLENVRPYLTTGNDHTSTGRRFLQPDFWTSNGRMESYSRFRQVLQEQEGYQRPDSLGGYVGSPFQLYQRIRYRSRHLSFNTTLNKSPGEPYKPPLDFAFTSWHMAVSEVGKLESLVAGDFSVSFGQGLLLWTGGSFGKNSDVIRGVSKNERGILPSSSAQPATGFRGMGVHLNLTDRLSLMGFYSNKKRTSTMADDDKVNFPSSTGRYRTLNELNRKNNLNQETIGGRLMLNGSIGTIGLSAYQNRFNKPIAAGNSPYQLYNFSGQKLTAGSADIRLYFGNQIYLFSEIAKSDNHGMAFLSGAEYQLSESTTFVTAYRNYGKRYQSIYGSGFGEQSGAPRNEQGIYLGIRNQLTSRFQINLYMDQFQIPTARFLTRQPSSGYDWLIQVEYSHSRELQLYLLTRFKKRETEAQSLDPYGREIRLMDSHNRFLSRLHAEYRVHPKIRLRIRADFVVVKPPLTNGTLGTLIYTDLRVHPHPRVRLDLRFTMFDTDDFESRVFQFENDLLYVMTNTMLFDRGQRAYLLLYTQITDRIDFWLKISSTVYENRDIIGSGPDQIEGNRKSDIGFQTRIRF